MYESHYGLRAQPFKLTPDPDFYFSSRQHRRARAYLDYGVTRREGFIVITGEVGAGKTTVLRSLIETLDARQVVTAHLVSTQLDHAEVLRAVAAAFGIRVHEVPKADLLGSLEAFFISHTLQGRRCLLIVDEAQNLSPEAVEELRMLSNFQVGQQALVQSFLVGQPEFRRLLAQPSMEQFRQRVTATCHIGPLDPEDARGYVEHRLKAAGAEPGRPSFSAELFAVLHEASGGIPRRINALVDRLLLAGFLSEKHAFDEADMREVVREFEQESAQESPAPSPALRLVKADDQPSVDDPAIVPDRLARIERCLEELSLINRQNLNLLNNLVQALVASAPRADAVGAHAPVAAKPVVPRAATP